MAAPTSSADHHMSGDMATKRRKELYGEGDLVDEFLVHQVTKSVRYETLREFGRELKVKEQELEIIMAPNYLYPKDRIAKVRDISFMCSYTYTFHSISPCLWSMSSSGSKNSETVVYRPGGLCPPVPSLYPLLTI